jgi:hypothetical protein
LLHASTVTLTGTISAVGGGGGLAGNDNDFFDFLHGRGGGGGIVDILTPSPGAFVGSLSRINVAGANAGRIEVLAVPEPSIVTLLSLCTLGAVACARSARRRNAS